MKILKKIQILWVFSTFLQVNNQMIEMGSRMIRIRSSFRRYFFNFLFARYQIWSLISEYQCPILHILVKI